MIRDGKPKTTYSTFLPCGFKREGATAGELISHYGKCDHDHCKGLLKVWQHLANSLKTTKGIDLRELVG